MGSFWSSFIEAAEAFGWERALFTVFFFGMHYAVYKLYMGRLNDRQQEIDRLRKENNDYRERFTKLLDDEIGALNDESEE